MFIMKILIVASQNTGKMSPFVVEQMEALRKEGCEVDTYGVVGHGVLGYLKNLPALKEKIKECKPDIVHAHYGLCGMLSTLQNDAPVVITFHNGETLSFIANVISSVAAKRAKYVIYVAEHIRKLSYLKASNFAIIPCGVNLEDIITIPQREARKELGFEVHKKYILFGGAFANLRKNYPLLKKAVDILNNRDNIECIEMKGLNRQQITKLMCAVDCFVLPTKSEGSPQALKEAMACNCPIVATDVADIKHLLGECSGHYICSFDPFDVAAKLKLAFEFNNRTNGRERIVELGLSNDLIAKRLMGIYNLIIAD